MRFASIVFVIALVSAMAPTARADWFAVGAKLGAPLTEVGDRCLYFLGKGSLGITRGTYYVALGAFQGRFVIRDSVAARYVPADWVEGNYTSLSIPADSIDKALLQAELAE